LGGKSHEFVVGIASVLASPSSQPCDSVLVHSDQTGSLANSTAFREVFQDRQNLVVRQLGVKERRTLELRKPVLADLTVEQPVAGSAEVVNDKEIALAALAVQVAVRTLAAKPRDFIRGHDASWTNP
jgi:hypothetical protein